MTVLAELEQAIKHLLRAKERAQLLHYPQPEIDRLSLLQRAAVKSRADLQLWQPLERKQTA